MIRDFSEKKKEEIYAVLDIIDNKEWKSFMTWCGGKAAEFGVWTDKLGILSYTKQIDNYQNRVLNTNSSTRNQINVIFENVVETDNRYAEIFRVHAETVKGQIEQVRALTEVMGTACGIGLDKGTIRFKMEIDSLSQREEMLLNGRKILLSYLEGDNSIDSAEREKICDIIMEKQPDMMVNLYVTNCYSSSDTNKIYNLIINYYNSHIFGEYAYPLAYINGIIKAYETHKMVNGRFVLDNNGRTIGYGHDVVAGEDFSNGLSEAEALQLAISDLDAKYEDILKCIQEINEMTGMNINAKDFSENEMIFLIDFAYNRGRGLVKRPELPDGQPHSSLALLIIAVSEKDDEDVIRILKEEVNNLDGEYYNGLERRRMDEYEILRYGEYSRDEDMERGVW